MAVRSAREAAYETIRSRIITMELKPGDELTGSWPRSWASAAPPCGKR